MSPKTVLITGANRGIGLSIARVYALRFPTHTVILSSRSLPAARDAIASLVSSGVTASLHPLELDVASDASVAAAVQAVAEQHGKLDVLINNAGIASVPNESTTPAEHRSIFAQTLDVNVASVYNLSLAFRPLLAATAGTIVNISSGRASLSRSADMKLPPTASVSYSISKAALNSLSIELGKLLRSDKVGVVCVNPGHCRTAFNGFRGTREPEVGAGVVVDVLELGHGEGFWEMVQDGGEVARAPW